MEYLNNLSDDQYENLAKKIADHIAEHDTLKTDYRHTQRNHSGEIFYRMSMGSRQRAHKLLKNCLTVYQNNWKELAEDEGFADYILAFLCGGGYEVEWTAE